MAFGNSPKDINNIPIGGVSVPNHSGGDLTALRGANASTDGNGNETASVVVNVENGNTNGQATMANSSPVVLASDEVVPVGLNASTLQQWNGVDFAGDNAHGGVGAIGNYIYDGITGLWARQRQNQDNIALVASGAYTTTQTVADQTNINHRGCIIVLDVTIPGTGSITLEVDGKDPVSGKYYVILTGAIVTTLTTVVYRVYPGLTAVANSVVSDILPKTWRVKVTANNANSITYSVGAITLY